MGLGASPPRPVGECPRHYGIAGNETYSRWRHRDERKSRTLTDKVHGKKMAGGQITWLVRQGDLILPDKPVEVTQRVKCAFQPQPLDDGSATARITFCATALKDPPSVLSKLPGTC